jgi:hypothetical protein
MKQTVYLLTFVLIAFSACRNQFVTSSYEKRKFEHKRIAVIPIKSVYTGKIPEEVTPEDIVKIEDAESIRFQELINAQFTREAGIRRNEIAVELMSTSAINSTLKEAGVSVRQATTMNPAELGEILGVDVIVRGGVKMDRFLSDLNSLQIQIAETVLRQILANSGLPIWLPGSGNLSRTYRIESTLEALDVKDGAVLWQNSLLRNADWNYQPEDAIASMAVQYARNFPYRNREFK